MLYPVLNGTRVKVFKQDDTAEVDTPRHRWVDTDSSFIYLDEIDAQPYWFSAQKLAIRQALGKTESAGYLIVRTVDLKTLGISPHPDGESWVTYRFVPYIDGEWSTKFISCVEARPKCPLKGAYLFWYLYFVEVTPTATIDSTYRYIEGEDALGGRASVELQAPDIGKEGSFGRF